jgi:hypothetical protein
MHTLYFAIMKTLGTMVMTSQSPLYFVYPGLGGSTVHFFAYKDIAVLFNLFINYLVFFFLLSLHNCLLVILSLVLGGLCPSSPSGLVFPVKKKLFASMLTFH